MSLLAVRANDAVLSMLGENMMCLGCVCVRAEELSLPVIIVVAVESRRAFSDMCE